MIQAKMGSNRSNSPPVGLEHVAETNAPDVDKGNFWRGAKWSPDGTCVLAQAENRTLTLFQLPSEVLDLSLSSPTAPYSLSPLVPPLSSPSTLLSYAWYPFASSSDPATFCYVRAVSNSCIELRDAWMGGNGGSGLTGLRASYPIIDHCERFVAPNSMAFTLDGQKLYCGHVEAMEIFDISRPGEEGERVKTSPTKKSKEGQKGIISSLTFCPTSPNYLAAGSYSRSIGLYDTTSGSAQAVGSLGSKEGIDGGVVELAFHPLRPHLLISSSRLSSNISVFDLRNPLGGPVTKLNRKGKSWQRLGVGIEGWREGGKGRVAFGDQFGNLKIYDLGLSMAGLDSMVGTEEVATEEEIESNMVLNLKAHEDAISTASFHPYQPLLLTCSGSRHFDAFTSSPSSHLPSSSDSSSSDSSNSDSDSGCEYDYDRYARKRRKEGGPKAREACLRIWRISEL